MTPTFKCDLTGLNQAMLTRQLTTGKEMAEIVNQTAFNVAARAFHYTKPNTWNDASAITKEKWRVQKYLGAMVGGGNRFGSRHKRAARQLRKVTLIAQAIFYKTHGYGIGKGKSNKRTMRPKWGKKAKPGAMKMGSDYGDAMIRYTGKIFAKNVRSVGYLKAIWVPVLETLAPLVKFRGYLKGGALRGLRWKTSSAWGGARPAVPNTVAEAVLMAGATAPRMTANSQSVLQQALQKAVDDEAADMQAHIAEKAAKLYT